MAQAQRSIPAGLDAVSVGRIGLWLLGMRQQRDARARVPFPTVRIANFANRFAHLLAGWKIREYPGTARYLSAVLSISPAYARNLLKPSHKLSAKHARKLAAYLRNHASECEALAAEMLDYASQTERSKIYDKSVVRRRKL